MKLFSLTRRDCFTTAGALIASNLAFRHTDLAKSAKAQATLAANLPVRRPVHTLIGPNGSFKPELQAYHDALATLKTQPILWAKISEFHDIFCVRAGNKEVHGNWRFLAWHRAYLLTFERILREVSGNRDLAIPYWDWFAEDIFPVAFTRGALAHPNRCLGCGADQTIGTPDRGARENVNYNVRRPFGTPSGATFFGGIGPTGEEGLPEFEAHGGIHNWVGGLKPTGEAIGDMADLDRAAKDPCFYSHHANVDRIWEVWKFDVFGGGDGWKRNPPKGWIELSLSFVFDQERSYTYHVRDLLETHSAKDADGVSLGYVYDTVQPRSPVPKPRSLPFFVANQVAADSSKTAPATENKAADVPTLPPVTIPLGSVLLKGEPASTAQTVIKSDDQIAAANIIRNAETAPVPLPGGVQPFSIERPISEGRVVFRIGEVILPPKNIQLNFYLNKPDATVATAGNDPGYLGTLNYIPSINETKVIRGL